MVLIVPFAEVLCGVSSDLPYMGRGTLRCNQYAVLVHTGHIRSAGTDVAGFNAMVRGTGSGLKSGVRDFGRLTCVGVGAEYVAGVLFWVGRDVCLNIT
jgi:hypothetical protein